METLFNDTSIEVARTTHCRQTRDKIEEKQAEAKLSLVSSVVLREYKDRVLKDASYLLNLFVKHKSIEGVLHQLNRLSSFQARKLSICIGLVAKSFSNESEEDQVDRARLLLETLIETGTALIRRRSEVLGKACSLGLLDITVKESAAGRKYDFGKPKCAQQSSCSIESFFAEFQNELPKLLESLEAVDPPTKEIENIVSFLKHYLSGEADLRDKNVCKTVGDLVIAMESRVSNDFFTMNFRESQYLCPYFAQVLHVLPSNPDSDVETTA